MSAAKGRSNKVRLIHDFLPPEGVPITFRVAGLTERLGAQVTDILITGLFAVAVVLLIALAGPQSTDELVVGLGSLLFFAIRFPYYVLTELMWNGETLGKRMLKLKVVSADGRSLTAHAVFTRNLTKEAEVFLPLTLLLVMESLDGWSRALAVAWVVVTLAVPLFNKRRQRLGDLIAGTYVIHYPESRLLPDLAGKATPQEERFTFLPHQLDIYGAFELQTLETFLQTDRHGSLTPEAHARRNQQLDAIVTQISKKINYEETIQPAEHSLFLKSFYAAQRAHLEQRQLFGDRRADKFHGTSATD
ncbi:RDD family protein [Actibacterium sp. 188UL27-1]|uniref:RDD family protein n=1 Tax=Actibacterium sp. 188UL27-1 TaxID=2786961 RepID=UPI0019590D8F|nr:RDD family protein [Actibacterium sp. 188UL27-1]MBM7066340.1 RDD family protein [Actibacterium sp. 188UL27-1]